MQRVEGGALVEGCRSSCATQSLATPLGSVMGLFYSRTLGKNPRWGWPRPAILGRSLENPQTEISPIAYCLPPARTGASGCCLGKTPSTNTCIPAGPGRSLVMYTEVWTVMLEQHHTVSPSHGDTTQGPPVLALKTYIVKNPVYTLSPIYKHMIKLNLYSRHRKNEQW